MPRQKSQKPGRARPEKVVKKTRTAGRKRRIVDLTEQEAVQPKASKSAVSSDGQLAHNADHGDGGMPSHVGGSRSEMTEKMSECTTASPGASQLQEPVLSLVEDSSTKGVSSVGHRSGNVFIKQRKKQDNYQQGQTDVLQNLIDSTGQLMSHKDPAKHVSTAAERSVLKLFKRHGSILIKGRSGSGKSRLAFRLLEETQRETNRIPIFISFPNEWKLIPHGQYSGDFVVMIDDIFGSSNLVQSQVDEWTRLFEVMWPSVESGHIFLVITSRPEIIAQCSNKIRSYRLMKTTRSVDLDSSEFAMTSYEKQKLLTKTCGHKIKLSSVEIKQISNTETSLGFPQCCEFFASSKAAQTKGVVFFLKPYLILEELISLVKECDLTGYAVMILLLFSSGFLDSGLLNPFKSNAKFEDLVRSVSQICCLSSPPTYRELKLKADHLCGVYLKRSDKGYHFQHQSIFDAVFLDTVKMYPEKCISVCPTQMLIEFVRTDGSPKDDEILFHLSEEMYGSFSDRITELLCMDEIDILYHPSLNHDDFFQHMVDAWSSKTVEKLSLHQINVMSVVYEKHVLSGVYVFLEEYDLFEVDNLLAVMLVTCPAVIGYIFETSSEIQNIVISPQVLTCATYAGQNHIVKLLLDRGMVPDTNCFRALCASLDTEDPVTERVLHKLQFDEETLADSDMLYLASLHGKKRIVDFILGKCENDEEIIAFNCLDALFTYFKNTKRDNAVSEKLGDVIKCLLSFIPLDDEDVNEFFYDCAFHAHSIGLKALFERGENFVESQDITCFSIALKRGGVDCVDVVLKHCKQRNKIQSDVLHYMSLAAESNRDSPQKVRLLFQSFSESNGQKVDVNKTNLIGTTLLHLAVNFDNTEVIRVLTEEGAAVNVPDRWGMTPLHTAVIRSNFECIDALLDAEADVGIKDEHEATVLFYAEEECIARRLVDAGCAVSATDKYGNLPAHKAAQRNDMRTLGFLLQKGCDVHSSNNNGENVLQVAAEFGDRDIIEYLCSKGAELKSDNDGISVLHRAARSLIEPVDKLRYFIDVLHVPVDVKDKEGRTALFPAIESGDMEVIEFLLERRLDLKHRDQHGNTLLHALSFGHLRHMDCDKILKLLLDGGIDPDHTGYGNRTALHNVLEHDTWNKPTSLCLSLIDKTSNVNAVDVYGRTPLHHAARFGDNQFVNQLLKKGADKDMKDSFGCAAVDYVEWYAGRDADSHKSKLRKLLWIKPQQNFEFHERQSSAYRHMHDFI